MSLDLSAAPRHQDAAAPGAPHAPVVTSPPRSHPPDGRHPGPDRVLAVVVAGPPGRSASPEGPDTPVTDAPGTDAPGAGTGCTDAVLDALAGQSRRVDAVVGVDTTVDGGALARRVDDVVHAPDATLGGAVRAGLASQGSGRRATGADATAARTAGAPGRDWVWLLTGGVPAPDALESLLAAVEVAPSVAVAGCKHRDGARLVDAGLTLSRAGRPLTGVEPGDVDQGQLDRREDVLAVGADGMLVRRDVWDALGGFDPALHGHTADIDLCRRAWRAGHRVAVVGAARTFRPGAPARPVTSRRDLVHLRLAGTPLPLLPLTVLAVLAGGVLRALLRVAAKEPGRGLADLGAVLAVLARPDRVWRSRRRAARTAVRPRRALAPLLAGHREVWRWHRTRWQARRAGAPGRVPDPAPRTAAGGVAAGSRRPAAALVVALAALSLVALGRLLGPGEITGAALAAAPDGVGDLWAASQSTWLAAGLGEPGPADAFTSVLALVSLVAGGSPALAVQALLLLALPLAGWGAWLAAGAATRSVVVRGWAALTWALAPTLLAAVDLGRLGPLLAHLALPFLVWGLARAVTAAGPRSGWAAAAGAGLALAVTAAGAPVLLAGCLLTLLAVALTWPRRALPLVWTPLPALALLAPSLVLAVQDPRVLVTGPGTQAASAVPPAWQLLLGRADAADRWAAVTGRVGPVELSDALPLVASGVLLLVALAGLVRTGPAGNAARLGWLVAALGLATSLVAGTTTTSPGTNGWPGAGLSLMTAGLLVAGVTGADGVRGWAGAGPRRRRRVLAGALAVTVVLGPVATATAWTLQQAGGASPASVSRDRSPALPGVAVDGAGSPDRTRTLVLAADGQGVQAALLRGDGPGLEDATAAAAARTVQGTGLRATPAGPDPATAAVDAAAAGLVAGTSDVRPQLASLAAGYVLLLPGPGSPEVAAAVDGQPGLAPAGSVEEALLWRVEPAGGAGRGSADRTARLRVVGPDGVTALEAGPVAARAPVAAGGPGRLLVLSERADPGWRAELDGRRLEPVVHEGWAQAFALPADGGLLTLDHDTAGEGLWTTGALVVLGLTVLLAVPVPRAVRRMQGQR